MIKNSLLFLVNCLFCRLQFIVLENKADNYSMTSANYLYPKETSFEKLDKNFLNCYFKDSIFNTSYIRCPNGSFCLAYALFSYSYGKWVVNILKQGCFYENVNLDKCSNNQCAIYENEENKFCCCSGSLCNMPVLLPNKNFSMSGSLLHSVVQVISIDKDSNSVSLLLVLVSVMASVFVIVVVIYNWKFSIKPVSNKKKFMDNNLQNQHVQTINEELSNLDNYIHGYIIHNGNHTTVRLATYKGSTVVVKVYPPRFTAQLVNENEIYCLLPRHSNISNLIRTSFFQNGYLLLTFYPQGSLFNYLRSHTLTWNQLFIMVTSISNGLSFLHNEFISDKSRPVRPTRPVLPDRPVIVHQDLNSRNILLKDNGECVLADFKFSLRLGKSKHGENFSLIGSAVYAAPEVLLQSVIPRNWSDSLKKVDIYALAMVMWELCKRCPTFYKLEAVVEESTLPYVEELGIHPCIQKLRNFVCVDNKRPAFPIGWNYCDPVVEMLKTIITQCWDRNPSVRLSSSCILNRVEYFHEKKLKECHLSYNSTNKQNTPEFFDVS